MKFYCPNCQKEYEVEPRETITTLQQRTAYKATCPKCGQDMAEFLPPPSTSPSAATFEPGIQPTQQTAEDPQAAIDSAVKTAQQKSGQ